MKKFIVALSLVLVLLLSLGICASAEEMRISNEDGTYRTVQVEDESAELFGTYGQLSAPQNLEWNPNGKHGWIQWDAVPNCNGKYRIRAYHNGSEIFYTNWSGLKDHDGDGKVDVELIADDVFNQSGAITFSVQAVGDGTMYSDSVVSYSGVYNYYLPYNKLQTPTNIIWLEGGILQHDAVAGAGGYKYVLYDQNYQEHGWFWYVDNEPMYESGKIEEDVSSDIIEMFEDGATAVYVAVTALTYDVEAYQNSDPAFSPAIDASGASKDGAVISVLENAMNEMYVNGGSASDAVNAFINGMYEENLWGEDIAIVMEKNEQFICMLTELETAYIRETGINVSVENACLDSDYLYQNGIDAADINMTGAALNSVGEEITLVLSEPEDWVLYDEDYPGNGIAVKMELDGVYSDEYLEIPIKITMPVPTGITPDNLVIMHYYDDGYYEDIYPEIVYKYGMPYASFVLTGFSNFVFYDEKNVGGPDIEYPEEEVFATVNLYGYETLMKSKSYDGVIVIALYDYLGELIEVTTYTPQGYIYAYPTWYYNASEIKILWWNSLKSMTPIGEAIR